MIHAFGKIYDNAPGFIAATEGPDHHFVYANRSYRDLVGRDDLIGKRVAEALPEVAEQGFVTLLDKVYQTGEPFFGENLPIELNCGASSECALRYVNFVYQPMRDSAGKIIGLFAQGYDSTGEILAKQRLRTFQEELSHAARVNTMGTMAATLAHELNQPLTAVAAYASASIRQMENGERDPAVLKQSLAAILEAAERAGSIIRNLRELTKRGETSKSIFDLRNALDESINLVTAGLPVPVKITVDVPGAIPIEANPTQIMQVVINLVRNACESTSPVRPNHVAVSAWTTPAGVIVSVRDRGRGLSAEAAQNIFTWTDSDKDGGTGLGLAICRAILDSHGGRIWLEDASSDGCDFRFSLPSAPLDQDTQRG
jgi:two-component system sensor kinase FixL